MQDVRVRVHTALPATQVKPAAKIGIFIITAAESGVEAADLKKNAAAHEEGMTAKAVCTDVTPRLAYVPGQVIPGIIISGGNNDRKLRISQKRIAQPRQKVLADYR